MLAPKVIPGLTSAMKKVVGSAVRGGYLAALKTRETVAEAKEQIEDILSALPRGHQYTWVTNAMGNRKLDKSPPPSKIAVTC
jgi:hypothetical protein